MKSFKLENIASLPNVYHYIAPRNPNILHKYLGMSFKQGWNGNYMAVNRLLQIFDILQLTLNKHVLSSTIHVVSSICKQQI